MFVIGKIETVKRTVKFDLPHDEGKTAKKADFSIELKLRSQSEVKARSENLMEFYTQLKREIARFEKNPETDFVMPESVEVDQYVLEDVVNVEGLKDPDGNNISFDQDVLKTLLELRYVRNALIKAWSDVNQNDPNPQKTAEAKN